MSLENILPSQNPDCLTCALSRGAAVSEPRRRLQRDDAHSALLLHLLTTSRLDAGKCARRAGGEPMRFYNRQHRHYCGIDLHVKTMYVCILDATGQVLVHRNVKSTPEAFLATIAPYRDDLVVA